MVAVALLSETRDFALDHGAAVGDELAMLAQAVTTNGPEIEGRQQDHDHQDEQKDKPEAAVKPREQALIGIERSGIALLFLGLALIDEPLRRRFEEIGRAHV